MQTPTDAVTTFYTDLDRSQIDVQRLLKMGGKAVDSNAVFIEDLFIADKHRIGDKGRGCGYIPDSLNPERVLVAAKAIGIGQDALRRIALVTAQLILLLVAKKVLDLPKSY